LAVIVIWIANGMVKDRRRSVEIEAWRRSVGPQPTTTKKGKKKGKDAPPAGAKLVGSIPSPMSAALTEVAGGQRVGYYELVSKLAYLAVLESDLGDASDSATVICKVAQPGVTFVARPLPIVDGARVANNGVQFKKHTAFTDQYLVEAPIGAAPKPVQKWLSRGVRNALLDQPSVWLRVDGSYMTLTLFGPADAADLEDLVLTADLIFADHGADGAPSLVGDVGDAREAKDDAEEDDDAALAEA
jgi:hypothetical protein